MGMPRTYAAIRRMIINALLQVKMCRDIVRKSGVRFGSGGESEPYPSAGILASFGYGNWRFAGEQWIWSPHEGVLGLWPVPSEIDPDDRDYPTPVQQSLIQITGLSYVRAMMVTMGGNYSYYGDQVAFLPVYCANLSPLTSAVDSPSALRQYICPDGTTLEDWHLDSRVGGPKAYSWPPEGSGTFTASPYSASSVSGCFTSDWARPPQSELGADSVLVGVAVISRLPRGPGGTISYESGLVQVQGIPEEWDTEEFRDFYSIEAGGALTFGGDPPGRLVVESGQYYADWELVPGNFGYTDTEAGNLIEGWLHNASGWSGAGITFRQVSGAPVTFQIVEGNQALTYGYGATAVVTLGYDRIQAGNVPGIASHEAGHAFFRAQHSGSGVMHGGSPDGYPTADDIQSVIDWLAG